jgi:hypothetical protein
MSTTILWGVSLCSLIYIYLRSKERTASNFRVQQIKAAHSSEMSANFYQSAMLYVLHDTNIHGYCSQNRKFHIITQTTYSIMILN